MKKALRFAASLVAAWIARGATPAAVLPSGLSPERLFPGATFAAGVPDQEAVVGVRPGARPLRHDELLRYFHALDDASPRARMIEYARSYEGRPLAVLAVGDEATIARLDAFRAEHARRTDPRSGSADVSHRALESAPAVAWLAYGIHGDELSSTDAAAALAYWLVAGEDDRAQALRRELVVLIDPCENPDGRERFLAQTTSFAHAVPSPDTEDLSHTTVWPWGRGNHYLFDLNRDWFTMVQPESARSALIAAWNPQLMVDSHEMGQDETYLLSPPRHPFNPFLPPYTGRWWDRFAADQALALDARGYGYYTREWNEEFFPGYGSSWASYQGAIGILYEMASTEGTLVKQRPGTLRTFAEAVEHHVASSVANLETLRANRAPILNDYVAGRREAIRLGSAGPVRAWLLPPGAHPDRANALAKLLRTQGLEVLRLAAPVRAEGVTDARSGASRSVDLAAGTWMVPMDQPKAPLARVLLDPHVPMAPEFLREEREYLERGRGSRLYDTTAWSLPLAYGIDAFWSAARPHGDWRSDDAPVDEGRLGPAGPAFAWIFETTADRSVAAVAELLAAGVALRVAEKPFTAGGQAYPAGSILIKREGNPDDVAARLADVAGRDRIRIRSVPTAKAEQGPDLGGNHFFPLVAPRIGILTGSSVAPASYGALWNLLDREIGERFTALDVGRFGDVDLARFNVLVFPPASGYRSLLGDRGIERLKRWIDAGGTAIGIGAGAEFLADKELNLTKTRPRRQALDRYPPVVLGLGPAGAEQAGPLRAVGIRAPEPKDEKKKDGDPAESDSTKSVDESTPRAEKRSRSKSSAEVVVAPYDVPPVLGPGARPFAGSVPGTKIAPMSLATWLKPFLPPGKERADADDLERADERLRRFAPRGAFVRAELDTDLWLAWGLAKELDVWLDAGDTLVAEPPAQVVARFADVDALHLGGLLWPEAAGRLARTAYCTRDEVGRGQVILFLDEPVYRGWMLGTRRLLLNALLYGPGLGTRWSSPW